MIENRNNFITRCIRYSRRVPSRIANSVQKKMIGTITGVCTDKNVIAFTFDDGPHPEYTPRLVDILNKYNAKGTFFMVGQSAVRYPDIVKYVASSGHVIANHTWDHPAVSAIGRRERWSQILACEQTLSPYGDKLFRPPYGFQSVRSYLDARLLGYTVVTWTKTVEDWLDHNTNRLVGNITEALKPGSILLFHDVLYHTINDTYADRNPLLDAIDSVLQKHSDMYSFVTVPELLQHGKIQKRAWFHKADVGWLNALNNGKARQYPLPKISEKN